jgi:hypothetical protein
MATQQGGQKDRTEKQSHSGNNSHKGGSGNGRQTVNLDRDSGSASESSRVGSGNSSQGKTGGSQRSGR